MFTFEIYRILWADFMKFIFLWADFTETIQFCEQILLLTFEK